MVEEEVKTDMRKRGFEEVSEVGFLTDGEMSVTVLV